MNQNVKKTDLILERTSPEGDPNAEGDKDDDLRETPSWKEDDTITEENSMDSPPLHTVPSMTIVETNTDNKKTTNTPIFQASSSGYEPVMLKQLFQKKADVKDRHFMPSPKTSLLTEKTCSSSSYSGPYNTASSTSPSPELHHPQQVKKFRKMQTYVKWEPQSSDGVFGPYYPLSMYPLFSMLGDNNPQQQSRDFTAQSSSDSFHNPQTKKIDTDSLTSAVMKREKDDYQVVWKRKISVSPPKLDQTGFKTIDLDSAGRIIPSGTVSKKTKAHIKSLIKRQKPCIDGKKFNHTFVPFRSAIHESSEPALGMRPTPMFMSPTFPSDKNRDEKPRQWNTVTSPQLLEPQNKMKLNEQAKTSDFKPFLSHSILPNPVPSPEPHRVFSPTPNSSVLTDLDYLVPSNHSDGRISYPYSGGSEPVYNHPFFHPHTSTEVSDLRSGAQFCPEMPQSSVDYRQEDPINLSSSLWSTLGKIEESIGAVNCSVPNTAAHTDLPNTSGPGLRRKDHSNLFPSLSSCSEQEPPPDVSNLRRAASLPNMKLQSSFEEFTLCFSSDEDDETYWFQCNTEKHRTETPLKLQRWVDASRLHISPMLDGSPLVDESPTLTSDKNRDEKPRQWNTVTSPQLLEPQKKMKLNEQAKTSDFKPFLSHSILPNPVPSPEPHRVFYPTRNSSVLRDLDYLVPSNHSDGRISYPYPVYNHPLFHPHTSTEVSDLRSGAQFCPEMPQSSVDYRQEDPINLSSSLWSTLGKIEESIGPVNYSVPNTAAHTDLPNTSGSGLRRKDHSNSFPSLGCCSEQEPPPYVSNLRRAASLPNMKLQSSFEEFTPGFSGDEDDETYWFQCSRPGLYQCRVSGLVFDMKGGGDVFYRVVPWNRRSLSQRGKKPAGPLFDISCQQQSVAQLHLPHCEVRSTGGCHFLSVAHIHNEGIDFIRPERITETHVIISISGFSAFGNVKDEDSPPDPVRALVLLFYKPPADPESEYEINVLLLPNNVVLRNVLHFRKELDHNEIFLETPPDCKLQPKQIYSLSTSPGGDDSVLVQPTEAEFDAESYDNYFSIFQVVYEKMMKHIRLILKDSSSSSVWERRVCLSTAGGRRSCGPTQQNLSPMEQLKEIKISFTGRVSGPNLQCLLDNLLMEKVLNEFEKQAVEGERTSQDKARLLVDMVWKKGDAASSKMIDFLCKLDPFLSKDLGLM